MAGHVTPAGVFVTVGAARLPLPATAERLADWAAEVLPCPHCQTVGGCGCDEWLEAMEGHMSAYLDALVAQVEAKFPAVAYKDGGSRAEAAAELVRGQKVEYLGEQGGRDWWQVGSHRCSIRGGCDCADNAPPDPNGRKLCKHRLAAMFVRKQQDDHGLVAILRSVQGDRAVLTVQVLSVDTGNGRQYTLNSYRADGRTVTLDYADRVRFTEAEFAAALRVAGFGMTDRPVKLPGLNHRYILRRGAESAYTPRDTTAQEVEQKEREKRIGEIAALDAGEQNEIMQSLPPEVQAAIYQGAGLSR